MGIHSLCAPVRDVTQPSDSLWMKKYLGMFDFVAVVQWLVGQSDERPQSLEQLIEQHQAVTQAPIEELASMPSDASLILFDLLTWCIFRARRSGLDCRRCA